MKDQMEKASSHRLVLIIAVVYALSVSALAVVPGQAAAPPENRTYFTVLVGLDGPYSLEADCVTFTATEMCSLFGLCGSWTRTEAGGREFAITFAMRFEEQGIAVQIDGTARIDAWGPRDSLAGVAHVQMDGRSINFGFTGRPTSRANCSRLKQAWDSEHRPAQAPQDPVCLQRANFADPAESPYVLPYPVGAAYVLGQTYCYPYGGHSDQLAYDFPLPIGADVTAARTGIVRAIRDDSPDDGLGYGENNYIFIEHEDGSTALYAHVMQYAVFVQPGERVEAGQLIAFSGNSGLTGWPHLHFSVYRTWPTRAGDDLPVNFRNAAGPLDERGGLIRGQTYTARPYQ